MKITTKVKATLIVTWIATFICIMVGSAIVGRIYMTATYGEESELSNFYSGQDPYRAMYGRIDKFKDRIATDIGEDPSAFMTSDKAKSIEDDAEQINTFVSVCVDGKIIYCGSEDVDAELEKVIVDKAEVQADEEGFFREYMIPSPVALLVNQYSYTIEGHKVSVYLMTYYGTFVERFRSLMLMIVIMIAVILFCLSAAISALVYVNFVKPINKLKLAAENIGEGNLDTNLDVEVNRSDEIGELGRSFVEMQDKLGETVALRIQYENENRELISNISHDLKTPITTIKGYVEGIMDGVADTPEKRDRYLKMIYNKANEMDALINELSLYTNINNNAMPYEFHRIKMTDYFDDCIDEMRDILEAHHMTLRYRNGCDRATRVVVDPDQLKRVINNIVSNAIKYKNSEEGHVDIQVRETLGNVEISIHDDGQGVSKDNIEHIFDRTFREDSARHSTGGSGLGLAICKKIVEDHGGQIWATSEKNKGTTIYFTLKKYVKEEKTDE